MATVISNASKISPRNPNDMFGRAYGERAPSKPSKRKPIILQSVKPDLTLEIEYRQILREWIDEMHNSIMYWVKAAFRANEPVLTELAQDAVPAKELQKAVKKLTKRWNRNFDEAAPELAKWFAKKASKRSDKKLAKILRQGGFSVKWKMTKAQRDILHATINQNVSLIKSIPQQYLKNVEGAVMRSVQTGRDLETLVKDLMKDYKVSFKRAALIARDQNNKATSALNCARQRQLGITHGIWMHSHAGKEPRPSHVAMHGKKYRLDKGMWDKDEKKWIHPGELINCRCTQRPVVEGFD